MIQDYSLWDVIESGNKWESQLKTEQVTIPATATEPEKTSTKEVWSTPSTGDEKTHKKNQEKARSLLLMTLPNEHQLTFNKYADAKSMFEAIEIRFGGNEATRKTKKTLLKQQYENFSATSGESLDNIFNRLQKIVSQLAILGVSIEQEDYNLKFLRSLPSEWNTHVVVWMNKPDLDSMAIDDLYNNFKIVEQQVKRAVATNSNIQNMAFVTKSTNSINSVNTGSSNNTAGSVNVTTDSTMVSAETKEVVPTCMNDQTAYAFIAINPKGSPLLHQDLEQISEDDLEAMDIKWQYSLLSMRFKRYYQRTGKKLVVNDNDVAGFDKSKARCFNCQKEGHFARECPSPKVNDGRNRNQMPPRRQVHVDSNEPKAMLAIDGAGYDWHQMADDHEESNLGLIAVEDDSREAETMTEKEHTNIALMALSDSEVYLQKTCSNCQQIVKDLESRCSKLVDSLFDKSFEASTYKRGLDQVESQLVQYRERECKFIQEIDSLKSQLGVKAYELSQLKIELEKVKQAQEGINFKINSFDNATKSLENILDQQILDKSRKGLGYHAVEPPHSLMLNKPKELDLSYSGLEPFKQPEILSYDMTNIESNDKEDPVVTETLEEKKAREKKAFDNFQKIKFVKAGTKVGSDSESSDSSKKKSVKYAEMYRKVKPRGNQRNWNGLKTHQLGDDFEFYKKVCHNCGSHEHLIKDCNTRRNSKIINDYNSKDSSYYSSGKKNKGMIPKAVMLRQGLRTFNSNTSSNSNLSDDSSPNSYYSCKSSFRGRFGKTSTLTFDSGAKYFTTGTKPFNAGRQNFNTGKPSFNTGKQNFKAGRPRSVSADRSAFSKFNAAKRN